MNISDVWYEINDTKVKEITNSEAFRSLESNEVLLIYGRNLASHEAKVRNNETNKKQNPPKFGSHHSQKHHNIWKTDPLKRRQRLFQSSETGGARKLKRAQWKKIHTTRHEGYDDPDKKCYYIPRTQN